MLETLLLVSCLSGTSNSCMTSGEAYTKYSGIDVIVDQYGKEHPLMAQTIGAIGLFKERKVYFKLQGPWFYEAKLNGNDLTDIAWWKKDF